MMTIAGSVSQMADQGVNNNTQVDTVSKNLQNQIANAQKSLQDLSSDEKMTPEEKMKKRQEIQQEIASLNQQLRQHQIEQRKEQRMKEQVKKELSDNAQKADSEKSENQERGLSKKNMHAMISADSSMKQAEANRNVATQLDAKVNVMQAEIKLDSGRGQSTEKKQKELAKVQGKAQAAANSQMSVLGDANKVMKKAAEDERKEKKIKESDGLSILKGDKVPKKKIGEYVSLDVRA